MKKNLSLFFACIFTYSFSCACVPDFTHSYACAGDTVFFYGVNQPTAFTWDFGDTASGAANISHDPVNTYHVYATPGIYYATLSVDWSGLWGYQTQVIYIGTDCFNSNFSFSNCGTFYTFTNESTGNYTSSFWDFGDTASGINDTTSITSPHHTFSVVGSYDVSLITSDGINTDTFIQTLIVDTSCTNFNPYISGYDDYCVNDTVRFSISVASGALFNWDFGDPASGALNYLTGNSGLGTHRYSSSGTYIITVVQTNPVSTDTLYISVNIGDCYVWPGNTNHDGEVNMEDLFAIGLNYGTVGLNRFFATNNWVGQTCRNWSPGYMNLQLPINKKHGDCNGDGLINALDIIAIDQNYGLRPPGYTHNDRLKLTPTTSSDPALMVNTFTPWTGSLNVSLPIDLTALQPQLVYGISARIYYNKTLIVPGSVSVSFSNCWMGTPGTDLIGLSKDFYADGYVDFGMVRTDDTSRYGMGTIAFLNFTLIQPNAYIEFNVDPTIKAIREDEEWSSHENFFPVSPLNTYMNIISASIQEETSDNISVYPNPAENILWINLVPDLKIKSASLTDLVGRIIKTEKIKPEVNLFKMNINDIASGSYLLILNGPGENITKRIVIKN